MKDEQLLLYLQQIVAEIYASVGEAAPDMLEPEQVEKVKEKIRRLLLRFDVTIEELIPEIMLDEFFGGIDEAGKALVDEGIDVATAAAIGSGGAVAQEFRQPVYLDALQDIMDDTFLDLRAARRTAEESAITTIDTAIEEVKGAIAKGTIQGEPRKVIQAHVMKQFRDNGLTSFVTEPDVNGVTRRLPLDFYAMTVTRVKMREAGVKASTTRYQENGQDLVRIIERHGTCEVCSRFKDLVVSLTGKTKGYPVVGENGIKLPPYHPNCRGTTRVFVERFKTKEEIDQALGRNATYSPKRDNRTPAQRKAYEDEQKKRVKANQEKKQFMRWQEAMGADAPKTLGAFRRMKRENSPKFQELQSNYRSLMQNRIK